MFPVFGKIGCDICLFGLEKRDNMTENLVW